MNFVKVTDNKNVYADSTYDNWLWILVRTADGDWKHVDHGY